MKKKSILFFFVIAYLAAFSIGANCTDVSADTDKGTKNTQISISSTYCVVLRSDGSVWAWGKNGDGQLENMEVTDSYPIL
ncbi:RCC1 domain-containing protein [Ruminiclostridium papyrosolvens]|uniref:Uncharacterized protein n=1 Tax=Ruminiclostridium papyrosolvens C7 TaxID=1330534 RepID=U4R6Q0_9FIRM|nr:RCC1 domain-containing protein [Ruminiclostridium papyrosolvens]EPR13641.1 hypothetical protein L323_03390 [Ruminiclostridium papyrosolvens C7]